MMAFTIADARTLAESWFEETLDDADILVWGNEFLRRKVSNKLWNEDTADFADSAANTYYDLPSDFFLIVLVTDQANTEIKYDSTHYTISNGRIKFKADGDYTITYRVYPALIAAITATTSGDPPVTDANAVPLPDPFMYPMAEYLIFKYYNIEIDDEDSKAASLEYEGRVNSSLKDIYDEMQIDTSSDSFQVQMKW